MKALVLEAPGQLTLKDVPEPEPDSGEVLLAVDIVGLGGSETLALANPGVRSLPNIMGHGIAGTATDGRRVVVFPLIGCDSCRYCKRGDSRLCDRWTLIGVQRNGGFAERVAVPSDSLVEIPDGMTWEQAAFVEPFANSIGAWDKVSIGPGHRVLVIGAGALGLGLVAKAATSDLSWPVEIVDPSAARAGAAEQMGAVRCDNGEARRFDFVFDTVGSTDTRSLALRSADKSATVVLLGFATATMELPANELIRHEQRIVGSFVYSLDQFRRAVELARSTSNHFVTSLGWHDARRALEAFQRGDHDLVKAALRPNRFA